MGCSVVSVYNDEVIGKIGYPQIVLDDLSRRDFKQLSPLQNLKETSSQIQTIYGFTQSFTTTRLFGTNIKNKEYLVYTAGRFLVVFQPQTSKKIIVPNAEQITSFMVYEKLCVVGLNGGSVLLWDLQFVQTKLEILLPKISSTISSVGITEKYIFVTDSSRPHSIAYVYDIRTGKMLAHALISTFEPVLKSITVGQNLHVTVAADGVWFMRMLKEDKEVQIVRGMFRRFPKTSMLCVVSFENYVISGGVDGYLYFWKIKAGECVKAIKVAECQITAVGVINKKIIVGSSDGRVKVYTFQILKKKQTVSNSEQRNEEPQQDLAFIMIDSYLQIGQAIAFAGSKVQPHLYFCLSREGLFFRKQIPVPTAQKKLTNPDLLKNCIVQKLSSFGRMKLQEDRMSSVYFYKSNLIVDVYKVEGKMIKLIEERQLSIRDQVVCDKIDYNISTQEICFVSHQNKVFVGKTKDKEREQLEHEYSLIDQDFEHQKIEVVNFVNCNSVRLLCITLDETILVLQRILPSKYKEKFRTKYQNKLPQTIQFGNIQLNYEKVAKKWKLRTEKWTLIDETELDKKKSIHCGEVISLDNRWTDNKISSGQGFAILWSQ